MQKFEPNATSDLELGTILDWHRLMPNGIINGFTVSAGTNFDYLVSSGLMSKDGQTIEIDEQTTVPSGITSSASDRVFGLYAHVSGTVVDMIVTDSVVDSSHLKLATVFVPKNTSTSFGTVISNSPKLLDADDRAPAERMRPAPVSPPPRRNGQ